jgi:signal transduction histidine kinase/ligand-binding sensor domain-containing protein/DNA-binding response OmpR family regulator
MCMTSTFFFSRFRSLLFLQLIFWSDFVYGQYQNPTFVPVAPEVLSNSLVRCIYKDSRGFIWFGTETGLVRYDGTNAFKYEHSPDDKRSIPYNAINAIIEDSSHNLLIGTAQGLVLYNRERDNFFNLDSIAGNKNFLNNRYITALSNDAEGKIWIGTHGDGINVYDPKTFTFTYVYDAKSGDVSPTTNYITCFLQVGNIMWVGTKGGLRLFKTNDASKVSSPVQDKSVTSNEITQVKRDPFGNMWLATADGQIIEMVEKGGAYSLKRTVLGQAFRRAGSTILILSPDRIGNLWFGGQNAGLNYMDAKTHAITRYFSEEDDVKKIPTNSVRSVYIDDMGITWIGTYNKGAYLIDNNAKKFEVWRRNVFAKQTLPANDVRSFAEDEEGNVWIACYGGGLSKLDIKNNQLLNFETVNRRLATRYLSSLLFDSHGNLWIGTWGQGIYKFSPISGDLVHYQLRSKGFGDNKVFSIYEDKRKIIWVGTVGSGLFYFNSSKGEFVLLNEEKKTDHISKTAYVTSILEDVDSTIWAGTLYGLYALRRESNTTFKYTWYNQNSALHNISSFNIQTICEDAQQSLWFGTGHNGLGKFSQDGLKVNMIQKKDGLPGNAIRGILPDERGNLWISTNAGLSRFNALTQSFKNYTKDDGLTSNEFQSNAYLKSRDGKFYLGTDNGFISFYPDSIRDNMTSPVVYLNDFTLNNQPVEIGAKGSPLKKHISLTSEIELSHDQRSFMIDFVAINYGQSHKSQYCYMLKGFDKNWNCTGSNHTATYTNLDPGDYTFFVKAANSDGVWSKAPAKINIIIHPAPWNTWWAKLLYIVLFLTIIFILTKIRTERIKIKNQLELERLAREKEHALSESKTQFFTNISHEFRTPLSLILLPLESLISSEQFPAAIKDRLVTVYKSADKMMRLVSELMDFSKLESTEMKLRVHYGELVKFIYDVASVFNDLAKKRNIRFEIDPRVTVLEGWFDRDKLEKVVVNVLSNAFKFTPDNGQVRLIINVIDQLGGDEASKNRCLELTITDNGIGISAHEMPYIFDKFYQAKSSTKISNPGTGIGLSLAKGLIERHHGSIHAESIPNERTTFVIRLPIDRERYTNDEVLEKPVDILSAPHENPADEEGLVFNDRIPVGTHDRPQILVVEDNDELRKYISLELRDEFVVLEAEDGLKGFEIACEKSPDLIISDILMPVKTGIELCQSIKSDLKTSHIPFILLTAKTTVEDQIRGIETGADVYITKPFSFRFLIAHVRQIIQARQQLYSRFSHDVYLMPSKVATNEIDQAFLQKAIDYIVENIQDPQLGVDSVAGLFNLSRMQVYRKIKALTGKSVVEFIRTVRVKQALVLMEKQMYTLSEIAFQTGFNSASYFTRCFKDHFGKAPSEYLENRDRHKI